MEQELRAMQQPLLAENGQQVLQTDFEPIHVRSRSEAEFERESGRYNEVRGVIETGNGIKLTELLSQWSELGWLRDWRNEEDLTLYAAAITDGYIEIVNVLLSFDIPLGDALIRAIDVEFDDAIKSICHYIEAREDIRESVLSGNCDNDDFHSAITPLILAAQRNNFSTVKLLVELGAKITEPSLSQGGDVTLTQAVSTLHIYRALSQPSYIMATQTDIFGHAFELSKKLKLLSRTWEDFGAEYEQMARGVEVFAGEMLGQSGSTEEILALFRYHSTDQYRDLDGKQHHLAKLFEAIKYQQKEFIAHPHSQKAIIVQFYRSLLDWNEQGLLYQILLLLFVLLCYPIICLLYIFVPIRGVVDFARLPYVMMMMKAGSGFTFLAFVIAVTVINKHGYPQTAELLHSFILVWVIGLAWLHIKTIAKHGCRQYMADSSNLHELAIMGLYFPVFILQWNKGIRGSQDIPVRRSVGDAVSGDAFSNLQIQMASALGDLRETLAAAAVDSVHEILAKAQSHCRFRNSTVVPSSLPTDVGLSLQDHQSELLETVELGQFEPIILAGALFGVTITVSFLRLLNILLVSDSLGPLRISFGEMVGDIVKFFAIFAVIWFAFAIGLLQNFYSAGQSATRACIEGGEEPRSCQILVGFSSFLASVQDLYWSLYGFTGKDVLELPAKHSVAESVGTFLFLGYLIVAVLVLLNALIGMLSNTYNLTEENADMEWKFHRAAVWASYLRPVATLPPPFNLIPSIKSMYRVYLYIIGSRGKVVSRKDLHSKREREDYGRVLKLVSTRYIQANLSTESQNNENARPRDLQTLRNDILAFKFNVQDRLANIGKTLDITGRKTSTVHQKLDDLDPLNNRAEHLVDQSTTLADNVVTLYDETDTLQKTQQIEISNREQEASQLRDTIAELRTEIDGLNSSLSEEIARRDRLEANLNDAIRVLEEDKIKLDDTVQELSADKSNLTKQVDKLQKEAQILERESSEQKCSIRALQNEIEELKAGHDADVVDRERKEEELHATVGKLQDENKLLTDRINTLNQDKADLEGKVRNLSETTASPKTVPTTLSYTIAAHRVQIEKLTGRHSAEIEAKNKKEAKLGKTIDKIQEENRALTNEVKELGDEKAKLERKCNEIVEASGRVESESLAMKDELVELHFRIEELKDNHRAEGKVRDQQKMKLEHTIHVLEDEKTGLSETLLERDADVAHMSQTIEELLAEVEERNQQEAKLNDVIRGLQEENHALSASLRGLKEDKAELAKLVGQLDVELHELQRTPAEHERRKQKPSSKKGASKLDQSQHSVLRKIINMLGESFDADEEGPKGDGSKGTTTE